MVTAAHQRGYLRSLFNQAQTSQKSLFTALTEAHTSHWTQYGGTASAGRTPLVHSGNGRTVTFAEPDHFKFPTAEEKGETLELFFRVYADALTTLSLTQKPDWDAEQDTAIFNAMMADNRLPAKKVDSYYTDHLLGRQPYLGARST